MGDSPSSDSDESIEAQGRGEDISQSRGFAPGTDANTYSSKPSVMSASERDAMVNEMNTIDSQSANEAQTFSVGDSSYTPQTTLSNAAIRSLPVSQTNMMRGQDNTDFNFANSNAAQGLRDNTNLTGGMFPLVDAIAGFPSQMTLNALNRGQVPTRTDGMITGTTGQGFGANQTQGYIGGLANNQPGIIGGLNAASQVQSFDNTINDGSDNNDPEIIRRRMAGEVIPEEELDPVLSDDLAVNYLQNPNYLYSGQGNLYQPYGYAQGTLVDLLRTRNLTQPQQAAANLGLFGNPGDFS